jgi:hypothetical protein
MDGFAGPDQEASATDRNGFRGPQTVITCGTLLVAIIVHLVSIRTSRPRTRRSCAVSSVTVPRLPAYSEQCSCLRHMRRPST